MKRPNRPVPQQTIDDQARASDPQTSAWVSANAGSGKTHVLSKRVIRLLLDGCEPAKILCLTYTRAAAANMANRVFADLAAWAMLDDTELAKRVAEVDGRRPGPEKLARARRLFAEALDTPGGLRIQTIHAFCEAVLHQFPLEANIAAHFEMLDTRMEAALFGEARRELLTGAVAADNPALAEAFAVVLERAGEYGLDLLLSEIVAKRDGLRAFIDRLGGDPASPLLFEEFGFAPDETAASIASAAWPLPGFDPVYFARFAAAAQQVDAAKVINGILPDASAAFAEPEPEKRLRLAAAGLLTGKGELYKPSIFKKALCDRLPDLLERYETAALALKAAGDRLALLQMLEGTRAALTIADWLIGRYEQLKAGRGFLDFNDLVTRTVRLLSRSDAGAWVQYKLDQGIDHVLLDEAQDTSPDQWSVVRGLAEEFFAGMGARDGKRRTIFAVGDEKQSIYSFQGAAPEAFAATGHDFKRRVTDAQASFEHVQLKLSFRSTPDVLGAVDRVFALPEARRGISEFDVAHDALRDVEPGYVEIWPSVGAGQVDEPEDWRLPVDHLSAPAVQVADTVARTIAAWIDAGERIEGSGKLLSPGDVLVLVRKRDRFVHALARGLKEKRIAVAGADRLTLPAHIAVKDMMALGRVLLQREDDLSLAAVLRSPLFGLTDEQLFAIAADRQPGRSLWEALRADPSARSAEIAKQLEGWASDAAFKPPFEFYSSVLERDGGRRKMVARLGSDAAEILDEFLSFCLAEERTGQPGLEAFLATLDAAAPEIKREMDQGRDEVRIMTVHAAKGLEAPVVFLVDSGAAPFSDAHLPRLIPFAPATMDGWKGTGYLWRASSDVANEVTGKIAAKLRERADDEYRRLLYVGMTRAEDRLIVCGYHGKKQPQDGTWLSLVGRALIGIPETEASTHPLTGEPAHRFRVTPLVPVAEAEAGAAARPPAGPAPDALFHKLSPDEDFPAPLSPSGASLLVDPVMQPASSPRSPVLDDEPGSGPAAQRGTIIHRLLQVLPGLPLAERETAALRYLGRAAADWPEADRAATARQLSSILTAPEHAGLFSPSSRAEVSVMGEVMVRGRKRLVAGKIDRLAVGPDAVTILDYKTNRPPPASLTEVPAAYILQLALYRELLAPLYPGRRVEAALLFTEAPRLITVPAEAMERELARLTQA